MSNLEMKLNEMGIILPNAPPPAANYLPFVKIDKIVYVSGQISADSGTLIKGLLGDNMTIEEGKFAAKQCAINLLTQVKMACGGDLDRLERVVKLGGFVNSTSLFWDQPSVINGASDFLVDFLGEKGRHARTAVEIDGIFQVK